MAAIELQDAKDAPEGSVLFKYEVELSRYVRVKEKGRVVITTASPPERLKDRWDEVWDAGELLDEDNWSRGEDGLHEVILSEQTLTKRCPYTTDMEF